MPKYMHGKGHIVKVAARGRDKKHGGWMEVDGWQCMAGQVAGGAEEVEKGGQHGQGRWHEADAALHRGTGGGGRGGACG